MQNYPIARESSIATMARTANCAICQLPVDLLERPVATLTGAVFAHEDCALQFRRASARVAANRQAAIRT